MKTVNFLRDTKPEDSVQEQHSALVLKIYPDSILRQMCEPVEQFDEELVSLVAQL